jgi:hypothetical protein
MSPSEDSPTRNLLAVELVNPTAPPALQKAGAAGVLVRQISFWVALHDYVKLKYGLYLSHGEKAKLSRSDRKTLSGARQVSEAWLDQYMFCPYGQDIAAPVS